MRKKTMLKNINAYWNKPVTAYGVPVRVFVLIFICALQLVVDVFSHPYAIVPLVFFISLVKEYLNEKKKRNPYFPGC